MDTRDLCASHGSHNPRQFKVVEAAGVEPASEKVYRERLRAFPIRWF